MMLVMSNNHPTPARNIRHPDVVIDTLVEMKLVILHPDRENQTQGLRNGSTHVPVEEQHWPLCLSPLMRNHSRRLSGIDLNRNALKL